MAKLEEDLELVQKKIGYRFENKDLLLQAFTRSSYSSQYGGENNEVLEFIGDAVLDFCVVNIFVEKFGFLKEKSKYYDAESDFNEFCIVARKNENDFTKLKQKIVSNSYLAKRIDRLDFAKYLYLGDCDIKNNVQNQEKVKADLFEAIIGAISIDSNKNSSFSNSKKGIIPIQPAGFDSEREYKTDWNMVKLQNSVEKMLQIDNFLENIDVREDEPVKFQEENAISTLKELAEHGRCSIPKYVIPDTQVYDKGQYWWSCTCSIRGSVENLHNNFYPGLLTNYSPFINYIEKTATARATTKKDAKKRAAYLVLRKMYGID